MLALCVGVRAGGKNSWRDPTRSGEGGPMIVVGIVLLILGFLLKVAILWTLGIIVLVIGLILMLMGSMGRAIGGRRHYY
jgi:hypothetical protein